MNDLLYRMKSMGVLRNLLHASALLFILLMPFAGAIDYSGGWNLFFAGILPATAPILVIVIGLDIMMASIWRADAEDDAQRVRELTFVIRSHQVIGGLLLAAWLIVFLPALL